MWLEEIALIYIWWIFYKETILCSVRIYHGDWIHLYTIIQVLYVCYQSYSTLIFLYNITQSKVKTPLFLRSRVSLPWAIPTSAFDLPLKIRYRTCLCHYCQSCMLLIKTTYLRIFAKLHIQNYHRRMASDVTLFEKWPAALGTWGRHLKAP